MSGLASKLGFELSFMIPIKCWYVLNNILVLSCFRSDISSICYFLNKQSYLQFKTLVSITGLDFLSRFNRFELNYLFLSLQYNFRLLIKIYSNELSSMFNSITLIFPCAGWWERENWDMFGFFFFNNSDLRRILTDYGFIGFPLRKDFPVSGFFELVYNYVYKICFYSTLELSIKNQIKLIV